MAATALAALSLACADNATRLRFDVRDHVLALQNPDPNPVNQTEVIYGPIDKPRATYWLILLPAERVGPSDLLEAGVDRQTTIRIFEEMAYLDIGDRARETILVVQPDGKLNFTGPDGFAIPQLLALKNRGRTRIRLVREGRTKEWQAAGIEPTSEASTP